MADTTWLCRMIPFSSGFHAKHANPVPYTHTFFGETAIVRVHDVQKHLDSVEGEEYGVQRFQMEFGVVVSSEGDMPHLVGLAGGQRSIKVAIRAGDTVRIVQPDHLMELDQVNHVSLQTAQRLMELFSPGAFHLGICSVG